MTVANVALDTYLVSNTLWSVNRIRTYRYKNLLTVELEGTGDQINNDMTNGVVKLAVKTPAIDYWRSGLSEVLVYIKTLGINKVVNVEKKRVPEWSDKLKTWVYVSIVTVNFY